MKHALALLGLPGLLVAAGALAQGASAPEDASRGALLYGNHCIACHDAQMHWRERRAATDWTTLRLEVRRWQDAAHLNWTEEEIDDVAGYLNRRIYHFEAPGKAVSLGSAK